MKKASIRQVARYLETPCEADFQVAGYQIDSRKVGEGELFFALPGQKVDGHSFLGQVKANGAAAAVVSKGYQGSDHGLCLLRVEDVAASLQQLARSFHVDSRAKRVGITGSMGKTTVKEFLATLLEGKYKVGKTYSSYNTQLTFPLTLLNLDGDEEVLVLEIGMSRPGDIARLLEVAAPDVAVLTKLGLAHVASFGELEGIAREKASIFSNPRTKTAIFYHGFYQYPELAGAIAAKKISFSLEEQSADYFLSQGEGKVWIDEKGVRACQLDPPFRQPHVLHNFLAAAAAARQAGMEWEEIERQIPQLQLPKRRFEQFEKEGVVFVDDAYNANPDSMRAALSCLPQPREGGKRIAVLGAMAELGRYAAAEHLELGRFAQKHADHLLTFGSEAAGIAEGFGEAVKPAEHFAHLPDLAARLKDLMRPGDVVLVKGSRIMELEKIFELLNVPH